MKMDGMHTLEELREISQHRRKALAAMIKTYDDDEAFEISGTAWWAKYSSVDTPEKALACINHLLGKRWITLDHIRALLINLQARFGFEIDIYDAMS